MRDAISPAVIEPILPSVLRASLGVERPRELDELRRALMTRSARPERPRARAPLPAPAPADTGLAPSDIVRDAPAARRICEAHHRANAQLLRRGRRQRVGLAGLVAAVALTGAVLFTERRLDAALLRITVATPALLALAGLGVLATLGLRDCRRLVALQGERMVRGIDRGSTLPPARLHAFLAAYPTAATAFLACYRAWRRSSAPWAWLA
jgi:hypothetical protein